MAQPTVVDQHDEGQRPRSVLAASGVPGTGRPFMFVSMPGVERIDLADDDDDYGGTVPMLTEKDSLKHRPTRVVVAGTSGSGKTTLAHRIATVLGIQHVEIDSLYHGPQWTPRPNFREDVGELVARPSWVTEWQYGQVRPLLTAAADLMVWLDLGRPQVLWQVTLRTVQRRLRRRELWNGNVEPPLRTFLTDPDHIVRFSWRTHPRTATRVNGVVQDRPELAVVRLRSHAAARRWMAGPLTEAVRHNEE